MYYVYNRVSSIADVTAQIAALVPEAQVAYALEHLIPLIHKEGIGAAVGAPHPPPELIELGQPPTL